MTARGSLVSLAAVLLLVGDPRLAAAQYPIFDAHIHEIAWKNGARLFPVP